MENRLTNVRLAILLEIATTLGALTGVVFGGIFRSSVLLLLFSVILLVSAHQMFRKTKLSLLRRILKSRRIAGQPICGSTPVILYRIQTKKSLTA